MWPVEALHPVQAQLERFEAGTGCAAREGGAKETHVISVGKSSNTQVRDLCLSVVGPVDVHTSRSGVLFTGDGGVETFDPLAARQPSGDSGAELPACRALGVGERGTPAEHQRTGAGVCVIHSII